MLSFSGNKPYPIWTYRTSNIDKTLEKGQFVCYRTDLYVIVIVFQ